MTSINTTNVNHTGELNNDQIIALMNVYLNEWIHRDELFWKQCFKFFYANLIVIVLPNIAQFLQIDLPNISTKFFPIVGIIIAFVFLYVEIGYLVRVKAISDTYVELMSFLGKEEYKRISIRDRNKMPNAWPFAPSLDKILTIAIFCLQISIAIVLLIFSE